MNMQGNWNSFAGTVNLIGTATNSEISFHQNGGSFNGLTAATVNLSSNSAGVNKLSAYYVPNTNSSIGIGELHGTSDVTLTRSGGGVNGAYSIGAKST